MPRARKLSKAEAEAIDHQTDWDRFFIAYFHFLRTLLPDGSYLDAKQQEKDADALFGLCLGGVFEQECVEMYDPGENPVLLLMLTLAALDGYVDARQQPKPRYAWKERIASVDLAGLLKLSPRKIAQTFREIDVEPKTMRFDRGITKGYARSDVHAAWDRLYGNFLIEITEIDKKNRGVA